MRTFLSEENLIKAACMATALTIISVPRLIQGGMPMRLYLPATFLTLMLVCGAVAAWSDSAGMPGLRASRAQLLRGLLIAMGVSALITPIRVIWMNPVLREALSNSVHPGIVTLSYPPSLGGKASLLLWSVGFQVMCLQAAPMSIAARLVKRRDLAVGICVGFRAFVIYRQILAIGLVDAVPLFVSLSLVGSLVHCTIFAAYGVIPTMVLAGAMDLHLFFSML